MFVCVRIALCIPLILCMNNICSIFAYFYAMTQEVVCVNVRVFVCLSVCVCAHVWAIFIFSHFCQCLYCHLQYGPEGNGEKVIGNFQKYRDVYILIHRTASRSMMDYKVMHVAN